jgi:hypothetical protein
VLTPAGKGRPEVERFAQWIESQAATTRQVIDATEAAVS